jgi:hypothetical protein
LIYLPRASAVNPSASAVDPLNLLITAFDTPRNAKFRLEMFTLCLVVFLFVRRGASAKGDTPLTGWYEPPNERGTWDIIVSCVLTLTICVWSALHLNVPTEDSKLAERNYRRVRWIVLGLFAPELVVSTAFGQFLTARWLRREIQKDVLYRKEHVC